MPLEDTFTSRGWRRRGIAALLGVCATAALPPFYALPLLIPAFAGLFLLVTHAAGRRQAFSDGWWWGLGHFTTGLYWICISLYVEPEKFAWLTPFALFGLPSVLAVYVGMVMLALYSLRLTCHVSRVTWFAALWVGAEYLRAHLFTGFPWNLIGYVWTVSDATLQFASVVGIYGLSWIAVFAATMPALFFLTKESAKLPNSCAAALLLCMVVFGALRLETHPTRYTDVKVRIVQANVPQAIKWEPKALLAGLREHMRLTVLPGIGSVKLVLWPETAVPYPIHPESALAQDLGSMLPSGAQLITGGLRTSITNREEAWNSVFALDGKGGVVAEYDKHHLVPFGEYVPFRDIVPGLVGAVAAGMGDFSRGPGPRTLTIDPYPPFSPLVCYEAVFPGEATDGTGRAKWLLSLTDDAWFGVSTGPLQDAQMARVRAVEQGLPLLRAANTGISGAFDAYGRTLATLPLEKQGVVDLYLPSDDRRAAIYARYPQSGILFLMAASFAFLLACTKKRCANL